MRKCHAGLLVLAVVSTTHFGCADKSGPMTPSATVVEAKRATSGSVSALNAAPNLVVRTTPAADYSTNPPTIRVGKAPLTVFFGLCRSDDADQGDSLNWQFHFGDSGRPAFNENGTFNADHEHECRVEHEYREGTYTAWVSVTDKHLEDQSKDVRSLARRSQPFTIIASIDRPDCERGFSVNTGFEGSTFTPAENLAIPGVSFSASGAGVTVPIVPFLSSVPVPPLSGDLLYGLGFAPLEMTFQSDQESYRFDGAFDATAVVVTGFDGAGGLVFTHTFTPPPFCGCNPIPIPVSGGGRFRRLVVTALPDDFWALDNLSTQAACK